jgi:hypothetical protein
MVESKEVKEARLALQEAMTRQREKEIAKYDIKIEKLKGKFFLVTSLYPYLTFTLIKVLDKQCNRPECVYIQKIIISPDKVEIINKSYKHITHFEDSNMYKKTTQSRYDNLFDHVSGMLKKCNANFNLWEEQKELKR